MNKKYKIPCMIIRGGTSKGVYFLEEDLPVDIEERNQVFLKVMGSPDLKQINGLGGGSSVTSKIAIIKKSEKKGVDVDYTFCQVSVDKPLVSYKGNCGNILSGVGIFAIEKGLVEAKAPLTEVKIYNTNTEKLIIEDVICDKNGVKYEGDFAIAGVPGTASPLKLRFIEPAGTLKNRLENGTDLLPTGNAVDILDVPEFGEVKVSIVDAANPLVFVRAEDLGLNGTELPSELDNNPEKLELLEKVRGVAAVKLGLCDDYRKSAVETPGIPKMTFVTTPKEYVNSTSEKIEKTQVDLLSRMMSMQKTHPTYAMTGAMCTAAAAAVPGSVVQQVLDKNAKLDFIRIGHPGGVLEAGVDFEILGSRVVVNSTFGFRTANLILEGFVYC